MSFSQEFIVVLPPSLKKLKNLKEVSIYNLDVRNIDVLVDVNLESLYIYEDYREDLDLIENYLNEKKEDTIRKLDFSGRRLRKIPENIFMFKNLEELDFSNNNLEDITPFVKKLNKLKKLNVTGNNLKKLPDFLWTMPTLEEIWIDESLEVKKWNKDVIIRLINAWKNHEKWNNKQLRNVTGVCTVYNKN